MKASAHARAQLVKDEISLPGKAYNAALRFQKDRTLVEWYDCHIKGHRISEAQSILDKGVLLGEITYAQAETVQRVIDFAGENGK